MALKTFDESLQLFDPSRLRTRKLRSFFEEQWMLTMAHTLKNIAKKPLPASSRAGINANYKMLLPHTRG